jgi:hypothetical protein
MRLVLEFFAQVTQRKAHALVLFVLGKVVVLQLVLLFMGNNLAYQFNSRVIFIGIFFLLARFYHHLA